MRWAAVILLCSMTPLGAAGQGLAPDAPALPFAQFLRRVAENHPEAQMADLIRQRSRAELLAARGGFDPSLFGDGAQKQFDGKEYYSMLDGGVKFPTWFGIEGKAGYESAQGAFVNPELSTPINGLWYAGVEVQLGRGLLMDERRAALRSAQIWVGMAENEATLMLNDLLLGAARAYWGWYASYAEMRIQEMGAGLARVRLAGIRNRFLQGDSPALDTVEAVAQVQSRELMAAAAAQQFRSRTFDVGRFLWDEQAGAETSRLQAVPEGQDPASINTPSLDLPDDSLGRALDNHPFMQLYGLRLQRLGIQRRLQAEKLRPRISLRYNLISEPMTPGFFDGLSVANYKWGLSLGMPLLLRDGRGSLKAAKLRINEAALQLDAKRAELEAKVRASRNDIAMLAAQIATMGEVVRNYRRLLDGELIRFTMGESSVFLLNAREVALISAELKQVELLYKYRIAEAELRWALAEMR